MGRWGERALTLTLLLEHFAGEALGESFQGGLGGAVCGAAGGAGGVVRARAGTNGAARGDVDDVPAAAGDHVRQHGLAEQEWAVEVDAKAEPPVAGLHLEDAAGHEDAGVVDEDVDAAVGGDHGIHEGGDICFVGDVAADGGGAAAGPGDLSDGVGEGARDARLALGVGAGRDHDVRASSCEGEGDVLAEAPARSRDDCDLSVECRHGRIVKGGR